MGAKVDGDFLLLEISIWARTKLPDIQEVLRKKVKMLQYVVCEVLRACTRVPLRWAFEAGDQG